MSFSVLTDLSDTAGHFLGFVKAALIAVAGERVVARLRNRLYSHVLSLELGFFDSKKTGELVSRLGSDATLVQTATTQSISEVTMGIIKSLFAIGLMAMLSWKLTVSIFAMAILLLCIGVPAAQYIGGLVKNQQDALARAANASTEVLGSMKTVRSFNGEARELMRYRTSIGDPTEDGWCPSHRDTTLYWGWLKGIVGSGFVVLGFFLFFGTIQGSLWYGFTLVMEM